MGPRRSRRRHPYRRGSGRIPFRELERDTPSGSITSGAQPFDLASDRNRFREFILDVLPKALNMKSKLPHFVEMLSTATNQVKLVKDMIKEKRLRNETVEELHLQGFQSQQRSLCQLNEIYSRYFQAVTSLVDVHETAADRVENVEERVHYSEEAHRSMVEETLRSIRESCAFVQGIKAEFEVVIKRLFCECAQLREAIARS